MWTELMNAIYEDAGCEKIYIYDCISAGNETIVKNAMLYLADIIWELYYDYLMEDEEEYYIEYMDEEWKKYIPLLEDGEKSVYSFYQQVGTRKSTRKRVTLLNYIHVDKCTVDEFTASFPDSILIPFFILYLQNRDFFSLFSSGKKYALRYGENTIKFGKILTRYDDFGIYGYLYEKLTGVNLALLFANYFIVMVKCLDLPVRDTQCNKIVEDEEWKRKETEYRCLLKTELIHLLERVIKLPMIFGRILWADIALCALYIEEKKYIVRCSHLDKEPQREENCLSSDFIKKNCKFVGLRNADVVEYILERIEALRKEMEFKGAEASMQRYLERILNAEKNVDKVSQDRFEMSKEIYAIYKDAVMERVKDQKVSKYGLWKPKNMEKLSQWESVKRYAEKVISNREEGTIIGCENIGTFVNKNIRNKPNDKIPIIFMRDDIIKSEEYAEEVNSFLTQALMYSNNL